MTCFIILPLVLSHCPTYFSTLPVVLSNLFYHVTIVFFKLIVQPISASTIGLKQVSNLFQHVSCFSAVAQHSYPFWMILRPLFSYGSIFSMIDFARKWSSTSRMTYLWRRAHTFVDQRSQNTRTVHVSRKHLKKIRCCNLCYSDRSRFHAKYRGEMNHKNHQRSPKEL